jgi:hypothetical protein
MRGVLGVFSVALCCVLCADDQTIAFLSSPRAALVCALLFWLRCEWCMRVRVNAMCLKVEAAVSLRQESRLVKENFELSQTVKNLSEQHELLCAIRNTVLKALRFSKDTFVELRFPNRPVDPAASALSTPESKPSRTRTKVAPLVEAAEADPILKAKTAFRHGSLSDSGIALMSDGKAKED